MRWLGRCFVGMLWISVSLSLGQEKSASGDIALLSVYHSNDLMGYLGPCG